MTTKKEKKREALARARHWHNERKKLAASPSNPVRTRTLLQPTTTSPKRMSKREKQEARERARRWHELRSPGKENAGNDEEEEFDQSPNASPVLMKHQQVLHAPNEARSEQTSTSSAASGGTEPQREERAQWVCPRCTLLNPHKQSKCGSCSHTRRGDDVLWRLDVCRNDLKQSHLGN